MKRVFLDKGCIFEGTVEEVIQMISTWEELIQR
jgi:hypothetical protein